MGLPYERHLHFITEEEGPISPGTLESLFEMAPTTSDTLSFSLSFIAQPGSALPGSTAKLQIDPNNGNRIVLEEKYIPDVTNPKLFTRILEGVKFERLNLSYPAFRQTEEHFSSGSKALEILKSNLKAFRETGYSIDPMHIRLGHYVVRAPETHPGFFSNSYQGKVVISTEELIKDRPERKLILSYTGDMEKSPEVAAYKAFFASLKELVTH